MPVITCTPIGRFGNQLFSYAFARGYAEHHGYDFQCTSWLGQQVFVLEDAPITTKGLRSANELTANGEGDLHFHTYGQSQKALFYTRSQARKWFQVHSNILESLPDRRDAFVAHWRSGDYKGYHYPVVSRKSIYRACDQQGFDVSRLCIISDEWPTQDNRYKGSMDFLPDWIRLLRAEILFRANSSFSWWAGVLGNAKRIFSPVIDGLEGGKEHDVEFVEGNYPRLANLDFVTDLHLAN